MAQGSPIAAQIEGLDEFRASLRAAGKEYGRAMGQANKRAAEFVAAEARTRAISRGGSAAKGAQSIKASAAQKAAMVAIGGPRYQWMLGAEFGAKKYKQFPPWRGNQWQPDANNGVGYFLHPAIRDTRERFEEMYLEELDTVAKSAFPK